MFCALPSLLSGLMKPDPWPGVALRPGGSSSIRIRAVIPASVGSNHQLVTTLPAEVPHEVSGLTCGSSSRPSFRSTSAGSAFLRGRSVRGSPPGCGLESTLLLCTA